MLACDDGNRSSRLKSLFHDLAPFLLRTILPFACWLSGYDFRIPRDSHASRITASTHEGKTVVTGRLRLGGVHYRILYFFHGAVAASHGLAKERVVPPKEIDRAVKRKKRFEANPAKHTYEEA